MDLSGSCETVHKLVRILFAKFWRIILNGASSTSAEFVWRLVFCLLLMPLSSLAVAAAQRLFVVGDSYSDTGNFAVLIPEAVAPADASNPIPEVRSNGPLWVSQLFPGEVILPAWTLPSGELPPPEVRVINYAVARATTGYELTRQVGGWLLPTYAPYGMQWQFENMHRRYQFTPDDTLVIWGGVNDLAWAVDTAAMSAPRRLLEELRTPLPTGGVIATVDQAAANTMTLVERAVKFGFGRIVVVTTGGNTLTPLLGERFARVYNEAAVSLETAIGKGVERAATTWPDNHITRLDLTSGLHARAEAASLRIERPCVQDGITCDSPERFLFWDWTHPTTVGHCLIAQILQEHLAEAAIAPVRCSSDATLE